MQPNEETLEYAVSQSVDSVLPDVDRRRLGGALSTPAARQWADDHEQVTAFLRTHAEAPDVDYDALAGSFTTALAAENSYAPAALPMWPVWRQRLAVAAAVMLTGAAAWPFLPGLGKSDGPAGTSIVQVPTIPTPTTAPISVVVVGPSELMVQRGFASGLDTAKQTPGKPKVVITSAETPGDVRPY